MAHGNGGRGAYVYVKGGLKATRRTHKNEGKFYKHTRAVTVSGESPMGVETGGTVPIGWPALDAVENPQWG